MRKYKMGLVGLLIISMSTTLLTGCGGQKITSTKGFVQVYETTGTKSKLMSRQNDLTFKNQDDASIGTTVKIDEKNVKQEVEGLGGALTHSSAYVLMQMDKSERREVLEELYGHKGGVAFNMLRIHIGSSDYTTYVKGKLTYFSLDDMPSGQKDEKLQHFNIDVDKQELIPVIKEILEINPKVEIMATPWSAPAWMKDSDNLFRGVLKEEYEKTYAEYLVKYVGEYKKQGINIKYMSMQNEPLLNSMGYNTMGMDEYQDARMIKYVGERLEKKDLNVKMLAYDHNYDDTCSTTVDDYAAAVMGNKDVLKYTAGIAIHGYGQYQSADEFGEGFKKYNEKYGTKSFLTEIAEGIWSMDFANNISYSLENMVLTPLNYGSSGTMYWNLVLYDDGTPAKTTNDCLGLINISKEDGSYSKHSAYYSMAHVSKYIYTDEGNARVIGSDSDNPNILSTAFLRADGHIVEVLHNLSDKYAENVSVVYDEKSFSYEIQPQSVVTFIW